MSMFCDGEILHDDVSNPCLCICSTEPYEVRPSSASPTQSQYAAFAIGTAQGGAYFYEIELPQVPPTCSATGDGGKGSGSGDVNEIKNIHSQNKNHAINIIRCQKQISGYCGFPVCQIHISTQNPARIRLYCLYEYVNGLHLLRQWDLLNEARTCVSHEMGVLLSSSYAGLCQGDFLSREPDSIIGDILERGINTLSGKGWEHDFVHFCPQTGNILFQAVTQSTSRLLRFDALDMQKLGSGSIESKEVFGSRVRYVPPPDKAGAANPLCRFPLQCAGGVQLVVDKGPIEKYGERTTPLPGPLDIKLHVVTLSEDEDSFHPGSKSKTTSASLALTGRLSHAKCWPLAPGSGYPERLVTVVDFNQIAVWTIARIDEENTRGAEPENSPVEDSEDFEKVGQATTDDSIVALDIRHPDRLCVLTFAGEILVYKLASYGTAVGAEKVTLSSGGAGQTLLIKVSENQGCPPVVIGIGGQESEKSEKTDGATKQRVKKAKLNATATEEESQADVPEMIVVARYPLTASHGRESGQFSFDFPTTFYCNDEHGYALFSSDQGVVFQQLVKES
ncbi:unnamed protein product [Amoebophrya sp. A25]|nr:unnamed protein product [Amoebophrya sp. A25]|eukprot:GSA25T00020217001.1